MDNLIVHMLEIQRGELCCSRPGWCINPQIAAKRMGPVSVGTDGKCEASTNVGNGTIVIAHTGIELAR